MKSLRIQLTRELIIVLALLWGVALLGIYGLMWRQLNRSFNVALEARALGVSALVEQHAGRVELDFSEKLMRGFMAGKARQYFELRDREGGLLARSETLGDNHLVPPTGPASDKAVYFDLDLPNGRPGRAIRFLFQPKADDDRPPTVTSELIVAVDREDLDEMLGGLLIAVVSCGGLLLAAVFFVVPSVLRRGLVSVQRLGMQAARIDAASLADRFPAGDLPVELQPIAERLNDLLARLETSFERERRYSADLAHELRTPIAELRNLAECSLKWPAARDAAADQDTLAIALQMETLVTRLLSLARGERGQLAVQNEVVEIAGLVAATWRPFADRAAERGLRVQMAVTPDDLSADPVLLRSILGNLFDNAVNYAPIGGEIVVSRSVSGGLSVANTVDQFSPEDLSQLFERFWRKETARSGGNHAGLGLSLARTFASAMGWRLAAALVAGRLVFTLERPQTPAP